MIEWSWPASMSRQKASLFYFSVRHAVPDRAQKIASAFLDGWIDVSKPRPDTKLRLETELERAQSQWDATNQLIQQYEREAKSLIAPNSLQGELAGPLVELISKREVLSQLIAQKKDGLRGASRDVVLSPPTLPTERADPWRPQKWTAGAALLGLVLAFAFVLLKELWRGLLATDPGLSSKLRATRWGLLGRSPAGSSLADRSR